MIHLNKRAGKAKKQPGSPGTQGLSGFKSTRKTVTAYTLLLIMMIVVDIAALIVSQGNAKVEPAPLSALIMAPVQGMEGAAKISLFMLNFGGCMGIVNRTGAIDAAVKTLVYRLKGRELILVPLIMGIFSLLGSSYGFYAESVPFYPLLAAALWQAGYDTITACATVLLGAGIGCLGATINPFCSGIAIDIMHDMGIPCNTGIVVGLGACILVVCYLLAVFWVLSYAKKVHKDPSKSYLSPEEKELADKDFSKATTSLQVETNAQVEMGNPASSQTQDTPESQSASESSSEQTPSLSGVQKRTLTLFALAFAVMILGFIPWQTFNIHIFDVGQVLEKIETPLSSQQVQETLNTKVLSQSWQPQSVEIDSGLEAYSTEQQQLKPSWTSALTGKSLGQWFFDDGSAWFLVMAIIIALSARMSRNEAVGSWIEGAGKIVGVCFIIGFARGISWLLSITHLDVVILEAGVAALEHLPRFLFTPAAFLLYLALSIVITSTSGLAALSIPIMGPLFHRLGYSTEVLVQIFASANGLANLFSPMGLFLPGLMLAHVYYPTWLRWAKKPIVSIGIACLIILSVAMGMFS